MMRKSLAREYILASDGDRILDIGCGTAEILRHLPNVEYYGFDGSRKYIDKAKKTFGPRGHFECQLVEAENIPATGYFDIVLAIGILHHLDDTSAQKLFRLAHLALKPQGRLITLDGAFVQNQSRIAHFIIRNDRGAYVRDAKSYLELAKDSFPDSVLHTRSDLLRIPYTHAILECKKD